MLNGCYYINLSGTNEYTCKMFCKLFHDSHCTVITCTLQISVILLHHCSDKIRTYYMWMPK